MSARSFPLKIMKIYMMEQNTKNSRALKCYNLVISHLLGILMALHIAKALRFVLGPSISRLMNYLLLIGKLTIYPLNGLLNFV
jgi:hypothetical protein